MPDTNLPDAIAEDLTAGDLLLPAETIGIDTSCGRAFEILVDHPEWPNVVAVDDGGAVAGLIDRVTLFTTFAQTLLRDLYEKRPISRLMDRSPLIIDRRTDLNTISRRIRLEKPEALSQGFVIVDRGRYLGIGTSLQLMTLVAEQASRRSAALEEARHAAEAANRAKSAFLANLSHELRTPLNAVIGFSEVLEGQYMGPLGHPRYQEYVGDIRSSGQHLLNLINDLLDLAKAEADKLVLEEQAVDLREIARSCLRLMNDQAIRQKVALEAAIPPVLPSLVADPGKLKQMILNLLSNAVKFTPPEGRVQLSIASEGDGMSVIRVRDTGIGMTEDEQNNAMLPFTQIDNALSRNHKGTGLGLPLTRRLAELHGGRLEIDSAPGEGTVVTLRLPADRLGAERAMMRAAS
ncbi:ATP-binding protein [Inquilinus sp. CAU 1745]|uniref:sensor histidine kinase n=1 Tax=Inquilinus sp. CAU 1745 TaxID=3140369 RepID=UPI00325B8CDC